MYMVFLLPKCCLNEQDVLAAGLLVCCCRCDSDSCLVLFVASSLVLMLVVAREQHFPSQTRGP